MRQPLLDDRLVVAIQFDDSIRDYPGCGPTYVRELVFDGLRITANFSHLRVYKRLVEAFDGVHGYIIGRGPLHL